MPAIIHSESNELPMSIPFLRENSPPKSIIKVIDNKTRFVKRDNKSVKKLIMKEIKWN